MDEELLQSCPNSSSSNENSKAGTAVTDGDTNDASHVMDSTEISVNAANESATVESSGNTSSTVHPPPSESGKTGEEIRSVSADVDDDESEELTTAGPADCDASSTTNIDSSALSTISGEDDVSDVCSSIADSENADSTVAFTPSKSVSKSRKRSRQPPIMIGYKKRRKTQHTLKKHDEDVVEFGSKPGSAENGPFDTLAHSDGDDKSECSRKSLEQSSSEENLFESSISGIRSVKYSSVISGVTGADKFCWICHKEGGGVLKCLACPRVYHTKCLFHAGHAEVCSDDPSNFHCPECSAVLKADNVNTRSPVLVTVNLEQLCTLLKHVIDILKSQKDSHYFWGPVDTKEFPHYREYVVYPMDISVLEKNVKNKVYGCTEAFLADVKWIVHNSIVFNSRAAKITNVAKNLLKICKREILEIETCAECYYNSLVRKDTWFIEVCKKPHLLVWARLKGYPPWPAKAMKCKDGMVDCRFFGAHDKAWVPLKDCFLYSKITPQAVKVKKGSHLESGIQELEKHIKKLKDRFGIFVYPAARIPYHPSQEMEQLGIMLPNYNPHCSTRSTKYLIHPDRVRNHLQPKTLFNESEEQSTKEEEGDTLPETEEKRSEELDSEPSCSEELDKHSDSPPHNDSLAEESFESCSESDTPVASAERTSPQPAILNAEQRPSPPSTPKPATESLTPPRKLVSVKNIDSINASVTITPNSSPASIKSPEATPISETKDTPAAIKSICMTASSPTVTPERVDAISTTSTPSEGSDFDLSKIKEEPFEGNEVSSTASTVEKVSPASISENSSESGVSAAKPKRSNELDDVPPQKKVKTDPKCRTVNITENVTLSLINQSSPVDPPSKPRPPAAILKQKPSKPVSSSVVVNPTSSALSTSRVIYSIPSPNDVGVLRPKTLPVCSPMLALNRSNMKIQPRVVNHVSQTNGTLGVSPKTAVTVIPSRVTTKTTESFTDTIAKGVDDCVAECHTQFRKIFESTLEKLAGKGDLRARVISLRKEMEALKRNHELNMDEMRRDYEVQIAELRATSVAKTQFDLAAERLKFEQEKERAVKEAKSKQWCSNCQKMANYYCCWNTAYCDFECQKDHWIQHMHVCKNDVKKKTPESSENEPPRIMMQSEISNGYTMNGYDKTSSTYSYANVGAAVVSSHSLPRSNYNRPQVKSSTMIRTSRPLVPRVTCSTVTSSPSFNSSVSNGVVDSNTYQTQRPSAHSVAGNHTTVVRHSSHHQK